MGFDKELYEKSLEFSGYINSQEWRDLKNKRQLIDNNQCVLCKSQNISLVCHHLTYERLFEEDINDFITLCKKCHSRIHRICPPINIPTFVKRNVMSEVFKSTYEEAIQNIIDRGI